MKKNYIDGTYLNYHPTWHEEDSPWKAKHILKMIRDHNLVPLSICEVGCGAGEILNCLQGEFGEEVEFWGYEISPQAFEICKLKTKKNLNFVFADLLDEKNSRFDLILAIDVFEHVEDYFGFLRKLREKGEYKIFRIPLDLSVITVLRISHILNARRLFGHLHYFTKDTALLTLEDAGYEIIDYSYSKNELNRKY